MWTRTRRMMWITDVKLWWPGRSGRTGWPQLGPCFASFVSPSPLPFSSLSLWPLHCPSPSTAADWMIPSMEVAVAVEQTPLALDIQLKLEKESTHQRCQLSTWAVSKRRWTNDLYWTPCLSSPRFISFSISTREEVDDLASRRLWKYE